MCVYVSFIIQQLEDFKRRVYLIEHMASIKRVVQQYDEEGKDHFLLYD
jgi:hypothetical protein